METAGKRTPPLTQDLVINGVTVRQKGQIIHEKEWNRAVADKLIEALQRCGFRTLDVSPGLTDYSLTSRWQAANNAHADAFVSKHYNAAKGVWWDKGYTVAFISDNKKNNENVKKLARCVQDECAKASGWTNEGVQTDVAYMGINVAVLNNTTMPSVLTETGFMDVWEHAKKMLDPEFQKKDAEATCKGICTYFNVTYVPPGSTAPTEPVYASYTSYSGLNTSQREANAKYIYDYLRNILGATKQSACAFLANIEEESCINPGAWQSNKTTDLSKGYGLVQWTAATKFLSWAFAQGYIKSATAAAVNELAVSDPKKLMDIQLERIKYEVDNKIQWQQQTLTTTYTNITGNSNYNASVIYAGINLTNYKDMTFSGFIKSAGNVKELTEVFRRRYEQPGNPESRMCSDPTYSGYISGKQEEILNSIKKRFSNAEKWFSKNWN